MIWNWWGKITWDKPLKESFKTKIEIVQYNADLKLTGAFKGTLRDKKYREVGLESFPDQRMTKKRVFFHKAILELLPSYLKEMRNSSFCASPKIIG